LISYKLECESSGSSLLPSLKTNDINISAPPSGDTGQQQIRVEEDDSLAGKRTHGLPNITGGNAGKNKNNGKDPAVEFMFYFLANYLFFL